MMARSGARLRVLTFSGRRQIVCTLSQCARDKKSQTLSFDDSTIEGLETTFRVSCILQHCSNSMESCLVWVKTKILQLAFSG